ncbi:MAG: A/G-specific adenine glycosylase, partial [Bacteroidota bacterium]
MNWFSRKLLEWYNPDSRNLPWKLTGDAYKIWLSEIILQQTRVEQGTPYYLAFIHRYPTVRSLAEAPLDDVLKLWEGLGYYSRARNLHAAAKQVLEQHGGQFPDKY